MNAREPSSTAVPLQSPGTTPPGATPNYIVRHLPKQRKVAPQSRFPSLIAHLLLPEHTVSGWQGYAAALLGVALASVIIFLLGLFVHIANISLVYLPVVLWLAAAFGRGPALLGSVLAFLSYDFFFIPPLYQITVSDPTEWLSLFALLITALVLSQFAITVQVRAREARESQQRTANLYSLAQLIASATEQQELLDALVQRLLDVFASAGLLACELLLPDEMGRPTVRASTARDERALETLSLSVPERAAQAAWAMQHGSAVGLLPTTSAHRQPIAYALLYLPLQSGHRVVGVLGLAGTPAIHHLAVGYTHPHPQSKESHHSDKQVNLQLDFFHAFCDQIALALERTSLRQQTIHTEALRESDRLKDALLGSVTHDLRTPIASIKAAANTLLAPAVIWNDAERHELLESIEQSADRLNRLVGNLLDLSRLEAGVALPEKDWELIGDVIATVLDRLELSGQLKGRRVHVEVADGLPLVPLDHGQIEQVLTNLLENAAKYSPPDSEIRMQARLAGSPPELEVRVIDQGIGIPEQELQAIFNKFYRVQHVRLPWASSRPPVGTGLGLAICASIIHAHGGRIWAESRPGEGSTFVFTLPIPGDEPRGRLPDLTSPEAHAPSPPRAESTA